jgi:hypothetical protein
MASADAGKGRAVCNVVLFVPMLLAGVATRRRRPFWRPEACWPPPLKESRLLCPTSGRSCDTNDWLCNTIGAVIGALLAWVTLNVARRR